MDQPTSRTPCAVGRVAGTLLALAALLATGGPISGAEPSPAPAWFAALAQMPVPAATSLARSNAVRLLIQHFQSNHTVRALLVLPGVIDDFHLIHRDAPFPDTAVRHLAEVISTLTNHTPMRVTWRDSLLILHTEADRIVPDIDVKHAALLPRLQQGRGLPRVSWFDTPWASVHPLLKKGLKVTLRPDAKSEDAWHFERFNLAASNLSDWEMLSATALCTGTRLTVERRRVSFERVAASPH